MKARALELGGCHAGQVVVSCVSLVLLFGGGVVSHKGVACGCVCCLNLSACTFQVQKFQVQYFALPCRAKWLAVLSCVWSDDSCCTLLTDFAIKRSARFLVFLT